MPIFDPRGNIASSDGAPPAPTYDEVSSAQAEDITDTYRERLSDVQDEILQGARGGLKAYKRLKSDDQVHSTMQQRRLRVAGLEYEVEPASPRAVDRSAADFMRDQMAHLKWSARLQKMHWTLFYGFSIAEMMWATDGTYVFADEVKVRERSRFKFNAAGEPVLAEDVPYTQGTPLPDRKMWWAAVGADNDDEPFGLGLAHFLYWPVRFKREGIRFYLTFLEKYAHPTPIGKFPPGTPPGDRDKLLRALAAMTTDQGIIVPQGMEVDKFEAQRSGSGGGAYDAFTAKMDAAISKIVLSQTMTTDSASTGLGSTQGEVHERVADEVVRADATLLYDSWRRHPAQWLVEWNFPDAEMPTLRHEMEMDEPEELSAAASRDKDLRAAGWQRTQESMDETYGVDEYEPVSAPPTPAPDPAFAEATPEQDTVAAYLEQMQERGGIDEMMEPVERLIDEAETLEEVRDGLLDLYSEMDPTRFARILQRGMVAAEMAGMYEVEEQAPPPWDA